MTEEVINETVSTEVESKEVVTEQAPLLDAAEPAAETKSEPVVDDGKVGDSSFIESLPEDLRKEGSLMTHKDLASLAKSHVELQKKFGKRFEDLTADEIKGLDSKFGAPETAEDYGIELSEELKADPILSDISGDLLEAGIPKDKGKALMGKVLEKINKHSESLQVEAQVKAQEEVETIKKEFGSAFDARKDLANNALREFGGDEVVQLLNDAGLSNNPAIFRMLSEVGKLTSEDKPVGAKESRNFGMTPAEAAQKIAELNSDAAFNERRRNVMHPGHKAAMVEYERLFKIKAGK
jgi:hypothetical protein